MDGVEEEKWNRSRNIVKITGLAAGEAGRRRYSHKELTQNVIKSCRVKVEIKSFYQKRGLLEVSKNSDLGSQKSFLGPEVNQPFIS